MENITVPSGVRLIFTLGLGTLIVISSASDKAVDAEKHYTGFSKPAVNIRWTAQENGCYEIYRASKDARSGYSCIDRVETAKSGPYVYTDSNARIGSNYYKIRQVIKEDDYITQEVSTACRSPAPSI